MKNSTISLCFLLFVALIPSFLFAQNPPFYTDNSKWADSVFQTLSPDERIAQLFMVAAYSNRDQKHIDEIKELIVNQKIGGLIFFQGGPLRQAYLTNTYQALSRVPLLLSIDAEWGLAMRLDSTVQFPHQMTLGAIQNDSLIYEMGAEIARQCKRLGIHINFAPVADVNNNPLNPVISNRSFGEDKYNVTRKAMMYMKGMQDNGVLANAKHFPGHGDTESDSHLTLPVVNSSRERMDTLELYPFKQLIAQGLGSVMVAHLYIPAIDTTPNQASTLTPEVVNGLLKKQLGFKGLVFTDALNMKGVSQFYKPGEVDVKALVAGNDILLFAEDVPTAINEIKAAIERGEITQEEIDERCKKALLVKQWVGLNHYAPINTENLYEDLNNVKSELINRKLTEASITLLKNEENIVPLKQLDKLKIASLSIGSAEPTVFQKTLSNYAPVSHFNIDKKADTAEYARVLSALTNYNLIIIYLDNTNSRTYKNFGLSPEVVQLVDTIISKYKTIVVVPENPYILERLDSLHNAQGIIMSYENNAYSASYAAQLIFGGIAAQGKLPITSGTHFKSGSGIATTAVRLKYTIPEELNIDARKFLKIDSIALNGIKEKAYPGCQLMVVKNGKVIYQKSYGYHTYDTTRVVKNDDLYDLASITKVGATTISLMRLVDNRKIGLDDYLCYQLPELAGSDKENLSLREILTHQAGLKPWIAFWQSTMIKEQYKSGVYNTFRNNEYPNRVANKLYIKQSYTDSIYKQITESPLTTYGKYVYSDLGYYFLLKIIEQKTMVPLDRYAYKYFYAPLGLSTMGYKPLNRFDIDRIVPTEDDKVFRKQLIQGDVNDQGAAMLGGVGGHAGLFSNANDLAVLMQMLMNYGEYGGERYLDSNTVKDFTKCQYCADNRRALGFDKPETNPKKDSPVCDCVSYLSFGHTGFTGTIAWADPEKQLVYIFLSNRVYPNANDNKLVKLGIRSTIQEAIYDALK